MSSAELICARGRTLRELEEEGVGSNVYLQRETEALSRLVSAPRYDDDLRNSLWVREACYPGMAWPRPSTTIDNNVPFTGGRLGGSASEVAA
ncbi:hypothetical protein HPB50_023980 [Hyalomma asiaticum]|uniref:Uncharacterized protein n=1 Tax=Hyalomma asiaticum TaxID=266040 RepID=A0ACB7S5F6_HYAAI|nr:hypothetical protein HPB50_023980 [Hyalomma asiaticum]